MKIIIMIFTLLFFAFQLKAEENDPSIGLSAAITGNQLDIMFPFLLKNDDVIMPSVGVLYREDIGQSISASLKYKHYTGNYSGAKPYLGVGVGGLISIPEGGDGSIDFIVGLSYGVEYFFSKNFSCGLEAQLNGLFADKNSTNAPNPGKKNINTATMVFISIYY